VVLWGPYDEEIGWFHGGGVDSAAVLHLTPAADSTAAAVQYASVADSTVAAVMQADTANQR